MSATKRQPIDTRQIRIVGDGEVRRVWLGEQVFGRIRMVRRNGEIVRWGINRAFLWEDAKGQTHYSAMAAAMANVEAGR